MPSPLDNPEQPTPAEAQGEPIVGSITTHDQPPQPLAIDFGEATGESTNTQDEKLQTMDLGEDNVIKLDSLGPMIINSDGVSAPPSIRVVRFLILCSDTLPHPKLVRVDRYGTRKDGAVISEEA